MLKHADIWRAVDRLAAKNGLSASGLARKAGLDPTTFNKSKRITKQGKQRWPSTESLSKILDATGASLGEFLALIGEENAAAMAQRLPALGFSDAVHAERFTEVGHPSGDGWDQVLFPQLADPSAYALEVSGSDLEPVYRDGDTLIVSPRAGIRRGDRLLVKTKAGRIIVKELQRQSAQKIELSSLSAEREDLVLDASEVDWMVRVVWASQ